MCLSFQAVDGIFESTLPIASRCSQDRVRTCMIVVLIRLNRQILSYHYLINLRVSVYQFRHLTNAGHPAPEKAGPLRDRLKLNQNHPNVISVKQGLKILQTSLLAPVHLQATISADTFQPHP